MFDFLKNTPIDEVVVAANQVIRALELRQDISSSFESSGAVADVSNLSYEAHTVARSIVDEIRQVEGLPISYLTGDSAANYTATLAEIVQRTVHDQLSNEEIQRGRKFLGRWQYEETEIRSSEGANKSSRLLFFLLGTGIGAALASFLAPKSDVKHFDSRYETTEDDYETTRERAAELYDMAAVDAGEIVPRTREATARQRGSISAAVERGKRAYVEEKRKTELSGRTEAAPTYKPEKTM